MNQKQTPLEQALSATRKFEPFPSYEIRCRHCNDVGVTSISSGLDEPDTLAICDCIAGADQIRSINPYKLPQWSRAFVDIFTRKPCPIRWFKPEEPFDFSKEASAFKEKTEEWRAKIEIAELYWAQGIEKASG